MTIRPLPDFVRLSPVETQLGFPFEPRTFGPSVLSREPDRRAARAVLEDILQDALSAGACYVTFSGGRDSSALLAVAVHVARRNGLPLPIPVTAVHPEAPASDEAPWQHLVLSHLGISERLIVEIRGEQRLLSPSAAAALDRRGAFWPEATALQGPLLGELDPGAALVSGEGGDSIIAGGRAAPVRRVLRTWPPRRRLLYSAARALVGEQSPPLAPAWLTTEAAEVYRTRVVDRERLRWDARTRDSLRHPAAQVLLANVGASIAECGLRPVLPIVDPAFLAALAREGGILGFGGRGLTFRHLAGDLLPREVIFRSSKASFNETRWGEVEREFAREWDGSGIDARWVDAELLRAEWLSDAPHPASDFLLHVAWTAQHGKRSDPAGRTNTG